MILIMFIICVNFVINGMWGGVGEEIKNTEKNDEVICLLRFK